MKSEVPNEFIIGHKDKFNTKTNSSLIKSLDQKSFASKRKTNFSIIYNMKVISHRVNDEL